MGNSCEVKEKKEFQHPSLCYPLEPEVWGSAPKGNHPTRDMGCLTPSRFREAKPLPQVTQNTDDAVFTERVPGKRPMASSRVLQSSPTC